MKVSVFGDGGYREWPAASRPSEPVERHRPRATGAGAPGASGKAGAGSRGGV